MLTYKLRDGTEVLAKMHDDGPYPVTYANYSQAEKRCAELGEGWKVRRPGLCSRAILIEKLTPVIQSI